MEFHMAIVIYHNPRCSKSRQTLQLLRDHGVEPEIIEYLRQPPSVTRLRRLLRLLDMKPRDLLRRKEKVYKELGLDDPRLREADLIRAMVDNPVLIERPIVVKDDKAAVIGRPPENVLEIL